MTVYMVTFDSFFGCYGSNTDLLGIYDSQDKANEAIEKAGEQILSCFPEDEDYYRPDIEKQLKDNEFFNIHTVEINDTQSIDFRADIDHEELHGGIYLGGYIE